MPTTTIRIDDDLKERIAAAAERVGTSAHAFMVDAITLTVEQSEEDAALHRLADERWANIVQTGETVGWEDMKSWLRARARGEVLPAPAPRRFGKE